MAEGETEFSEEDIGGTDEVIRSGDALRAGENIDNPEEQKSPEDSKAQVRKERVNRLADEAITSPNETIYANLFAKVYFRDAEFQKLLEHRLEGRRLIDLGSGESVFWTPVIASHAGASEYIGVDKYHLPSSDYFNDATNSQEITNGANYIREEFGGLLGRTDLKKIEFSFQRDDMLKFLAVQEDGSANIVLSGIDSNIISSEENPGYIEALLREIDRVAGREGVVIGVETALLSGLEARGFEVKKFGGRALDLRVYIRKQE